MIHSEWAVVVGSGLNALGVVRSLASEGVRVAVVSATATGPALRSRFTAKQVTQVNYSKLPCALRQLAEEIGGKPFLLLTEEEAVRVCSEARNALAKDFRFRFGPHDVMMSLTHKEGVQALNEQCGMPIPKAIRLRSSADFHALGGLRYPCALKPGLKHAGYGEKFKKAYVVHSPNEAIRLFEEIAPTLPDLVVQEWIQGGDDSIYFCLQYIGVDGQAVASFTGRKLRAWPPQIGGTASCTAATDAEHILGPLTTSFFRAVAFQGMGSIEYKRDERDGQFYVVEPTVGRTDFQEEVATLNGCNLPYAAFAYECGIALPDGRQVPKTIWREPTTDRWSAQEQGEHPDFKRDLVRDAFFRWNDPVPWLALQWSRAMGSLQRRAHSP
ncbi:carboxylate--amine ligase [Paucibacter sp. AS339]|uniref:carboxylate--amine ligase n=1 Tax=Paucibacter hankyongi TaxID=3133434 RepID=UPI0030A60F44